MIYIADSKNTWAVQKAKVNDMTLDWSAGFPSFYDAPLSS